MSFFPAHCDHNCKDCSQNNCGWCSFLDIPVEGYDSNYNTAYTDSDKYPKKEE